MSVDLSNWLEDTLPDPPEGWDPIEHGRKHIERLWELRANMNARLRGARRAGKSAVRKWDASLWYAIRSWSGMTGDDPTQGIELGDKKVDLSVPTEELALAHRQHLLEEGSKAVTWALRLGHRRAANKMSFYLDRELEDLDRIFLS